MSTGSTSDICVIGGGPAGSTIARRLAQMGHSVVLVEKYVFPRPHVGESLTPATIPLFDALGIREKIEHEEFFRPKQAIVHWPPFHGYKSLGSIPGFQVDRGRFDSVLLGAAAEAGAHVLQGARLMQIEQSSDGRWKIAISWQKRPMMVECSFLVDASGRGSVLTGKKLPYGPETLAAWAYWRSCGFADTETRIEAGTEGWYWGAPLPDGTFNVSVFMDLEWLRNRLREVNDLEFVYRDLLRKSELLAPCLKGTPVGPTRVCDATCYYDDQPVGKNFVRVGEASFSVDPLSSQGVQVAIGSSLHAAAVVHTIVQRPQYRDISEQFYRERQQEAVSFHRSAGTELYTQAAKKRDTLFWYSRADHQRNRLESEIRNHRDLVSGVSVRLAPETKILESPCVEGDFIVLRKVVTHPTLARPAAFLDGIDIAPLFECLEGPIVVDKVLLTWSRKLSVDQARRVLRWFWDKGLIVRVD